MNQLLFGVFIIISVGLYACGQGNIADKKLTAELPVLDSMEFYLSLSVAQDERYHLQFVNGRLCLGSIFRYVNDSLFSTDIIEISRYCKDSVIVGPCCVEVLIGDFSGDVKKVKFKLERFKAGQKADTLIVVKSSSE